MLFGLSHFSKLCVGSPRISRARAGLARKSLDNILRRALLDRCHNSQLRPTSHFYSWGPRAVTVTRGPLGTVDELAVKPWDRPPSFHRIVHRVSYQDPPIMTDGILSVSSETLSSLY